MVSRLSLLLLCLLAAMAVGQRSSGSGAEASAEESCSNNFFLMEQSLLDSADNRFSLLRAFYPARLAHPVVVRVHYRFGLDNETQLTWFWTESPFYLIQPLEIFQFTSLFFSNMPFRQGTVTLQLDEDCSSAPLDFFEFLTSRLKLYSQSPTTSPSASTESVSDEYTAVASSLEEVQEDAVLTDFVKVWLHLTLAAFPLGTWVVVYLCDPIQLLLGDKTWSKLDDEHSHGSVAALIQISVIFTFYVFAMDIAAVYFTVTSELISYDANSAFYLSTVTGVVIDLAAFVWVVVVLATSCHWDCKNMMRRVKEGGCMNVLMEGDVCKGYGRIKKLITTVSVAPVLCLANHLHYIIIAFLSDPFHAGSIVSMYIISFFLFYFVFRQFYNRVVLHSNRRPKPVPHSMKLCSKCADKEKEWFPSSLRKDSSARLMEEEEEGHMEEQHEEEGQQQGAHANGKCNCFVSGPQCHLPFNTQVLLLSLMTIGPFVVLYESILIILFFQLPIMRAIEDTPSTIYTVYQGTGLIIVSLLTYNILLNPTPFSAPKLVERVAKRLHIPESVNFWNRLTTEEKCAKVIATLLENQVHKTVIQHVGVDGGVAMANGGSGTEGQARQRQSEHVKVNFKMGESTV